MCTKQTGYESSEWLEIRFLRKHGQVFPGAHIDSLNNDSCNNYWIAGMCN